MKKGGLLLAGGALVLFLMMPKKKSSKKSSDEDVAEVSKEDPKKDPDKEEPVNKKPEAPKSKYLKVNGDCSEVTIGGMAIHEIIAMKEKEGKLPKELEEFGLEYQPLIDKHVLEFNPQEQNFFDLVEDILESIAPACVFELNPLIKDKIKSYDDTPEKTPPKYLMWGLSMGMVLARLVALGVYDDIRDLFDEIRQSLIERGFSEDNDALFGLNLPSEDDGLIEAGSEDDMLMVVSSLGGDAAVMSFDLALNN